MTPRGVMHMLALFYLQALRAALALGVPRDTLAADVCSVVQQAGAVLETPDRSSP